MPALRDVVAVLDELYDPRLGRRLGRRRHRGRRLRRRRLARSCSPSIPCRPSSTRRSPGVPTCWSPTIRSTSPGSRPSPRRRPRAASSTTSSRNGVALHTCHTNADSPPLGVSESMALALGLTDVRPLEADADATDTWVVFVPDDDAEAVAAAMHDAGAGAIGDYDRAMFQSSGTGSFRPLDGATPAIGQVGEVESVDETRVEMVAAPASASRCARRCWPRTRTRRSPTTSRASAPRPTDRGSGRIGQLPAADDASATSPIHVADRLPAHRSATRVAGDLDRDGAHGRAVRRIRGLPAGRGRRVWRRRLRDVRPAPPPGERARRDVRARAPSSTCRTGPRSGRGCRSQRAGRRTRVADTVETRVSTIVTDPWTHARPEHRGAHAESRTVRPADPARPAGPGLRPRPAQHRRTSLPEHARIAELQARVDELDGQRIEADTEVGDLTRAQAKADAEVEHVKARRVRDEERLSSGAITNPRTSRACSTSSAPSSGASRRLEDEELEVMEQLEEAQKRLSAVTADLDRDQGRAGAGRRRPATPRSRPSTPRPRPSRPSANRSSRRCRTTCSRSTTRSAPSTAGSAAAALRARRCEGCRLEINGADLREIAAKPDDEVLRCPECSRILVRTAESGL